MDAAKNFVSKHISKTGHHTDVDETVNPAVTQETIKPTRHEETTTAVDREVHQHHYHTTVQPLQHQEVTPEKHSHQALPVEQREYHHGDHDAVRQGVSAELGQFKDSSITHQTQHTQSAAPTVAGEHVHHHVHETVQPVIHKTTVTPEVVHTTRPIHETHHAEAQHHGISALPMKTLDEFKTAGGALTGSTRHTHEEYEGAPRPYNEKFSTTIKDAIGGHHGTHGTTGTTRPDSGVGGVGGVGGVNTSRTTGTTGNAGNIGNLGTTTSTGTTTTTSTTNSSSPTGTKGKPSLMDKLNPKVDADGDGKAGIMS